jgi:tetratricopeptide (TPR) repeat protein
MVYAKQGNISSSASNFEVARTLAAGHGWELNSLCYTQASVNVSLDLALADCNAALKILPKAAPVLDSRAFVLLRQGHFADAIDGYNAALASLPSLANSLYGRGLAEIRAGMTDAGQKDLARARALSPDVDADFASMGLKLGS